MPCFAVEKPFWAALVIRLQWLCTYSVLLYFPCMHVYVASTTAMLNSIECMLLRNADADSNVSASTQTVLWVVLVAGRSP